MLEGAGGALLRRVHPESRTVGSEDEGGAALLVVFEKCAANRLHHEFLIFTSVHQRCRRFVPALLYRQLECPRLEKRETWGTPQLFLCQLSNLAIMDLLGHFGIQARVRVAGQMDVINLTIGKNCNYGGRGTSNAVKQ